MACATTVRVKTLVLASVVAAMSGGVLTGCGGGGEEQDIISSFFRASRVDDRGTMAGVSMVDFNTAVDGRVSGVSVESVSEEQRRPLRMLELSEALAAAQAAVGEHLATQRAYQDENLEAVTRVINAEQASEEVGRGDTEVQEAWAVLNEESAALAGAVSEAELALDAESVVPERSAFDRQNPIDARSFAGQLVTKEATVSADVELDGVSEERTMMITLQKVELGEGEEMIDGRWMITAIE